MFIKHLIQQIKSTCCSIIFGLHIKNRSAIGSVCAIIDWVLLSNPTNFLCFPDRLGISKEVAPRLPHKQIHRPVQLNVTFSTSNRGVSVGMIFVTVES